MNNITKVGRALTSSALCRASSFILLKSAHTGHSPVTSAVTPSANVTLPTYLPSSPANSGRSASSLMFCSTGIKAVRPSREIMPASTGIFRGSTTDTTCGPSDNFVSSACNAAGSSAIGVFCWNTTTGFSEPSAGKSTRSSLRTASAAVPFASHPAPDNALVSEMAKGADAIVMASHTTMTTFR